MSQTDQLKLVPACILSRLDYCTGPLRGWALKELQLLTGPKTQERVTAVPKTLHWLQVSDIIDFKALRLVYKSLNASGPGALSSKWTWWKQQLAGTLHTDGISCLYLWWDDMIILNISIKIRIETCDVTLSALSFCFACSCFLRFRRRWKRDELHWPIDTFGSEQRGSGVSPSSWLYAAPPSVLPSPPRSAPPLHSTHPENRRRVTLHAGLHLPLPDTVTPCGYLG